MTDKTDWMQRVRDEPAAVIVVLTHLALAGQFASSYWRPDFVREELFGLTLGLFVFAFLSTHSGVMLAGVRGGATTGRIAAAVVLLAFYGVFVFAFGILVLDSLSITLIFSVQLASRAWGSVRGRTDAAKHDRGEFVVTAVLLVGGGILAHLLPFPGTGVAAQDMDRLGGEGDLFWFPHEAILFGLLFTLGSATFEIARLRDPGILAKMANLRSHRDRQRGMG